MTTAILLASGQSKRMGRDKLLLPYKDKPLAAYVITATAEARVDERMIVTNNPQLVALAVGFRHVPNPSTDEGISAAVRAGVLAATLESRYLFLTADQPFVTAAILDRLLEIADQNPDRIITAAAGGRRGSPTLFPNLYREQLLALRGDTGGREIIARNPEQALAYEVPAEVLWDIDVAADYARLLGL